MNTFLRSHSLDSQGGVGLIIGVSCSLDFVLHVVGDFHHAPRNEVDHMKPSNYWTWKSVNLVKERWEREGE